MSYCQISYKCCVCGTVTLDWYQTEDKTDYLCGSCWHKEMDAENAKFDFEYTYNDDGSISVKKTGKK